MIALAKRFMQSPKQAYFWSAILGASTLIISPVGVIAGALIALITLAEGLQAGIKSVLFTALGGLLTALTFSGQEAWLLAAIEFWLPGMFLAVVYGKSKSLAKVVQSIVVVLVVVMAVFYLNVDSPANYWRSMMQVMVSQLSQTGELAMPAQQLLVEQLPGVLTMLIAMGMFLVWLSMLLLARWWQANLYQGDFAAEFQQLNLGNGFSIALAVGILVVLFKPDFALLQDVLGVLMLAFMIQGLAVIHFWVNHQRASKGWLIAIYVLLGIIPHFMVMVASLGWMENWLHWREKIASDLHS